MQRQKEPLIEKGQVERELTKFVDY